jgi:hypothetical protein
MARKTQIDSFIVEGSSRFPLDMLRYDVCVPHSSEDVQKIQDTVREFPESTVRIKLLLRKAVRTITLGRWRSFGWQVVEAIQEDGSKIPTHQLFQGA